MLTFLHLSDLHISTTDAGSQFDRDLRIRQALLSDLGREGRTKFDAILVTGDITYQGHTEEFARAKAWLEEVRTTTSSSPEALFVVPGNHDVNRSIVSRSSSLWDLHQSLRKSMSLEDRLGSLEAKLKDPFDFLTALTEYRAFAAEYGCPTTPKELAWVQLLGDGKALEDGTLVRFHGLNSALLSDSEDAKSNLLLGAFQFAHFSSDPSYVNIVLCHHPHNWLIDDNESNDYFRKQAHVVLYGHDHNLRCYNDGGSLRLYAGAIYPSRHEPNYEPCYHVLRLSVRTDTKRELVVSVETRVWRDKDKCFGKLAQANGSDYSEERIVLPPQTHPPAATKFSPTLSPAPVVSSSSVIKTPSTLTPEALAAGRRKLIVHFFRIGTLARFEAVMKAGVWEEGDDAFDGQSRWARVFERAEKTGKLGSLWDTVASKDDALARQPNPFRR